MKPQTDVPHTRRNLYLPDDLWAAMQKRAAKISRETGERVSMSEVLRDALRLYLKNGR